MLPLSVIDSLIDSCRWVYLVFFNMLWVVFPIYAIKVAYDDIANAFMIRNGVIAASVLRAEGKKAK